MLKNLEKKPFSKNLIGPRIQLIEAIPALAERLWESILRDRECRGQSWQWVDSVADLKEYLSGNSCEEPVFEVVYMLQQDSQIFGTLHVHKLSYADHKTEVGYAIEKSFEGQGFVAEALQLIEQELKRLGFNKIVITCDVKNLKSIKVAERAGFSREGTLIQDSLVNGKFRDTAVFGKIL